MPPCAICGREGLALTRHHLLPQCRQNKPRFQRRHSREEGLRRIALLCRACHSFVHSLLSEKELEQQYNTVNLLLSHPEVQRFSQWLSNKPAGYQPLSRKRKH
jgi:hypothetical protein